MDDITKFVSDKSREETMIHQFFRLAEQCGTKQEMRDLEQALLKPVPLAPYKGTEIGRTEFKARSLIMAFPSKDHIDRLKPYMRINSYKDNNTWDVDMFVEMINLLERGRLTFDSKKKKFKMKTKKGKMVTL